MKLKLSLTATPSAKKLYPKYTIWKSDITDAASHVITTELPEITSSVVSVIFQTDDELLDLNKRILDHDYYTDIITFELEHTDTVTETEVYISLDRATENAERFGSDLRSEVMRLVIHGLLHVAGYSDKSPQAKKRMQKRERFFLSTIEE